MPLTRTTLKAFKTGNVFVETGTLHGEGIQRAIEAGYGKIISIEIDPAFVHSARDRFKDHPEVEIVQGDTKRVMGEVISKITEQATFWLDAHWDLGPVKGEVICPLYDELTFIKNHPIKNHLILVDDMRIMGNNHHHWGKTVQKESICNMIKEINKDYMITYTEGDLGPDGGGIQQSDILVARV